MIRKRDRMKDTQLVMQHLRMCKSIAIFPYYTQTQKVIKISIHKGWLLGFHIGSISMTLSKLDLSLAYIDKLLDNLPNLPEEPKKVVYIDTDGVYTHDTVDNMDN